MRTIACAALCYALALSGIEIANAAETPLAAENPAAAAPKEATINLRAGPPVSQSLTDEIAKQDAIFFAAFFDRCDVATVSSMLTDDFEFYHDKDGESSHSAKEFLADMQGHCDRLKSGGDFPARRELVRESLEVYPLNKYGAVEIGVHRFYALRKGQPDLLTETSKFTQLWKQEDGRWKLSRVISYGHTLAEQPKP
jgi:ketosteroid isomerase-like protein